MTYNELIEIFELRPIKDDQELDQAIKIVDKLTNLATYNIDEQDYLDILSDIVEKYEKEKHPIAPVSDIEMFRHLLESKGITQLKTSKETGICISTISAILAGRRRMNRDHMVKLGKFFKVDPSVFISE